MQGVLAAAGEALGFAPCHGAPVMVRDATAQRDLAALVATMEGHQRGSAAIDADFRIHADAPWELVRLRRMHTGERACASDTAEYVWQARGADGAWSLVVSPRRLLLRHREHAVPASFRYRPFDEVESGVLVYQASTDRDAIHAVLRSGRCGRAEDGSLSDYAIEVNWRGARLVGCAWNGDPRR